MDDYPVNIGRMLFTMVDPHRGSEKAYNRWYERDHFYAGCMIGEGWFAGSRWVATRALKDLRFPDPSPMADPIDAGSYLSIYWVLDGQLDPGWAGRQVRWLYANDRGFDGRTHVHTGMYDYRSTSYRDDDGVPVELALDHGYQGLAVVVVEPRAAEGPEALIGALDQVAHTELFGDPRVGMVASWTIHVPDQSEMAQAPTAAAGEKPAPGAPGGPSLGTDGGSTDRVVQLVFLASGPVEVWERIKAYAAAIDAGGAGQVTFAAPFFKTVVGTDTYADQLW